MCTTWTETDRTPLKREWIAAVPLYWPFFACKGGICVNSPQITNKNTHNTVLGDECLLLDRKLLFVFLVSSYIMTHEVQKYEINKQSIHNRLIKKVHNFSQLRSLLWASGNSGSGKSNIHLFYYFFQQWQFTHLVQIFKHVSDCHDCISQWSFASD